jgi:hypothetical protein
VTFVSLHKSLHKPRVQEPPDRKAHNNHKILLPKDAQADAPSDAAPTLCLYTRVIAHYIIAAMQIACADAESKEKDEGIV